MSVDPAMRFAEEVIQLRAERDRFRGALEEIARSHKILHIRDPAQHCTDLVRYAAAALDTQPLEKEAL